MKKINLAQPRRKEPKNTEAYGAAFQWLQDNDPLDILEKIPGGDKAAFDYLQKEYPELMLYPTVHAGMRFARTANAAAQGESAVLAVGQKAAVFEETKHFVNVVEGGGMIGYEAVIRTCRLIREAFSEEKETRELVQVKGLGCEVCIR